MTNKVSPLKTGIERMAQSYVAGSQVANKVSPLKTGIERINRPRLRHILVVPNKVSPLKTGIER